MASPQYFQYLSAVLDNLPSDDRDRFAELWKGYEQIFASAYQKWLEGELNTAVSDILTFGTEKWLPYDLTEDNVIKRKATYTSNQDISGGVNLSQKWLIRFSVDGGPEIEVDVRGPNPTTTSLNEIVDRINNAVGFPFARGVFEDSLIQFVSQLDSSSANITFYEASIPARDASEFVLGLLAADMPLSVPEYPFVYSNQYTSDRIVGIPELQNTVRDDSATIILTENTDYVVEPEFGTLAFKEQPPIELWARTTLIDQETPWNNFGWLMNIYDENSDNYLNVVQGLWFAFWTGPRPSNVRSSLYLLFGLPVAQEDGTVTEVTATSISVIGSDTGELFETQIPTGLTSLVTVGQTVTRFEPLVDGIDVFDKINAPGFIEREIGRKNIQRFLLDDASRGEAADTDETRALAMLEEHTFLPQISVDAFISPDINLSNVRRFLTDIKPLNKTFLFQVIVGRFTDVINITEKLGISVFLDVTPNVDSNQTTFADPAILDVYETNTNLALNVDSDILGVSEEVEVEVNNVGGHVETFIV